MESEVTIVGGSIAGLMAGKQIAQSGLDVTIFEEHREIGVPEKCDGLVSSSGIRELGLIPPSSAVQNRLERAAFVSPSGVEFEIDARKQNVIVLDRARFDKFLAEKAAKSGARIEVGKRVSHLSQSKDCACINVDKGTIESKFLLDCSGYESYINLGGKTLQGGQYLVEGNFFSKNRVEVHLDPKSAPGFFSWVIPISSDLAKIGVAGDGINIFQYLDHFSMKRGATPIRKMAAPVICGGPIKSFVDGRIIRAGDAAGQAKPTTGGGIYTGGIGGLYAGQSVSQALKQEDFSLAERYEEQWREKFGKEFRLQLQARNILEKLSSEQIDHLFEKIRDSDLPEKISIEGDFDRHSISIVTAFGISNIVSTFGVILSNELRAILT